MINFREAVQTKNASKIGQYVDRFRESGLDYQEIYEKARAHDAELDRATWDQLMNDSE